MINELQKQLHAIQIEQERLTEVEDVLRTMRSIAIEATQCEDKRRLQLNEQFQELQAHLVYLEREKQEPFQQNTAN
ncbi:MULTISPECIES: hypothetical protein [unclassified Exiguobacterium]|uniref:hypothetical protein n=1 Tax=unclassified Exiguobacterium TaxID=2644629 RepID=UPI00103C3E22|nr:MULTISPECIES: hypothetical protein [unclassified Exiguobacterium]TCI64990.1 hypothetical protein EVJ26_04295 [Exiguobacterium sp. SH3S1]